MASIGRWRVAACIGTVLGLLDAGLVFFDLLGSAGAFSYVPLRIFLVGVVVWGAIAAVAGLAAGLVWPRGGAILVVSGLTLCLFVVRLYPPAMRGQWVAAAVIGLAIAGVVLLSTRFLLRSDGTSRGVIIPATLIAATAVTAAAGTSWSSSANHSPARESDPDIFVFMLDTVPYRLIFDESGKVDSSLPNMARLAVEGLSFERAFAPAPWTLPSHIATFAGLDVHETGVSFANQRYAGTNRLLAERLRDRGYATAAVVSNSFMHERSGFERGFDAYAHAGRGLDLCRTAPGWILERYWPRFAASVCNWSTESVERRVVDIVENADATRPLFVFSNFMDAHDPYRAPCAGGGVSPLTWREDRREIELTNAGNRRMSETISNRLRRRQAEAIRCIDRSIGRLALSIERRGRERIIVILSDHGEQFGEHGLAGHGNSLYAQLLHVPLVISGGGFPAESVSGARSTTDLPSLLLSALRRGSWKDVPERGVTAIHSRYDQSRDLAPSVSASIVANGLHYIGGTGTSEQLFDVRTDIEETKNLIEATPAGVREQLRREARQLSRSVDDQESSGRFRALNYLR
jgi:arylsulfatase A-like enzyme